MICWLVRFVCGLKMICVVLLWWVRRCNWSVKFRWFSSVLNCLVRKCGLCRCSVRRC